MKRELIQEQIAYYRARAAEYDDWFFRRGRYDRGRDFNEQWTGELAEPERQDQLGGSAMTRSDAANEVEVQVRKPTGHAGH